MGVLLELLAVEHSGCDQKDQTSATS